MTDEERIKALRFSIPSSDDIRLLVDWHRLDAAERREIWITINAVVARERIARAQRPVVNAN